jgi:UDP-glucose 4-epimerase
LNIAILGAAGFIGTNLILALSKDEDNKIKAIDVSKDYFIDDVKKSAEIVESSFDENTCYKEFLREQDIVYHLVSTNNPTNSNVNIGKDIADNIMISIKILEACVECKVKKIVFISSGGTVYGNKVNCPINENDVTNPITTYGIQKLSIEKLLYLYNYLYDLDYSIIRLANPYGPYQRPNGRLGVVTTFVYKALKGEQLTVFGDGSVVRDYIFIDDAIRGIIRISSGNYENKIFNLGSGKGESVNRIIEILKEKVNPNLDVKYLDARSVDVPINVLDITRYKEIAGEFEMMSLEDGIVSTIEFFERKGIGCECK